MLFQQVGRELIILTFQIEQLQPDVDNEGKIEGIVNEGNYQQKEDLNAKG